MVSCSIFTQLTMLTFSFRYPLYIVPIYFCRFFMLLSALLFFLKKSKNILPQSFAEVQTSRSVVLIYILLTMTVATVGRGSRSCSSNSFQYGPGQCVWLLMNYLGSTLLWHMYTRIWESQSRSPSVQHGFQKHLSFSEHLRKLKPDHSTSFFDLGFLAVTCEEGKWSFEWLWIYVF